MMTIKFPSSFPSLPFTFYLHVWNYDV